jgi:hypothetical protein
MNSANLGLFLTEASARLTPWGKMVRPSESKVTFPRFNDGCVRMLMEFSDINSYRLVVNGVLRSVIDTTYQDDATLKRHLLVAC